MRFLFFFAAAYILMAAVACQPLREAKAELEFSKRAYRKSPKPPKPPNRARSASPKVKRRFKQVLETAGEAVTDLLSRFRSADGGSKAAAEEFETIDRLKENPFTNNKPKVRPFGSYDPSLNPAESRPETRKPFKFNGQETGYAGDTDRNSRTSKLYDRPPLSSLLGPEADKAGNKVNLGTEIKVQGKEDRPKHIWEDPKQRTMLAIAASASLLATLFLTRQVQQNIDTTNNLNAAIASANARNQAAAQQALAESEASEAAGSGRSRLQRRNQSLSATSHKQLSKRGGPLTKVGEAVGKVGTRIQGGWHKFKLAWLKSTLLRFIVLWGSAFTAVSAATAGTVIYEHKKDKKHKPEPQADPPAAAPRHDDTSHTYNKRSIIPTINQGTSHVQVKLEKRFNPFRAVSECFQKTSVVEGARAVRIIVQHYPMEAKRMMIKCIMGASAFLGVAGALLYYKIRGNRHPTPEPEPLTNQTVPVSPPVPAAASPPAGQLVHTKLYKRSINVDQTLLDEETPSEHKPATLQTRLSRRRAPECLVDELAKGAQEASEKVLFLRMALMSEKAPPTVPNDFHLKSLKQIDREEPYPEQRRNKQMAIVGPFVIGLLFTTLFVALSLKGDDEKAAAPVHKRGLDVDIHLRKRELPRFRGVAAEHAEDMADHDDPFAEDHARQEEDFAQIRRNLASILGASAASIAISSIVFMALTHEQSRSEFDEPVHGHDFDLDRRLRKRVAPHLLETMGYLEASPAGSRAESSVLSQEKGSALAGIAVGSLALLAAVPAAIFGGPALKKALWRQEQRDREQAGKPLHKRKLPLVLEPFAERPAASAVSSRVESSVIENGGEASLPAEIAGGVIALFALASTVYLATRYVVKARRRQQQIDREHVGKPLHKRNVEQAMQKQEQIDAKFSKRAPTLADPRIATEDALEAFRNRNRRLQRVKFKAYENSRPKFGVDEPVGRSRPGQGYEGLQPNYGADGTTNYPVGSSMPRNGYEGSQTTHGVGGTPNGRAGLSKRDDSFLAAVQHGADQDLSRRALISEKSLQQRRRAFSKLAAAKEFTAAFRLAASDLKSLTTNAPLTPLERQARNKRLRKYAYAAGTGAAIKALLVYIIIARHKDKKDQQRRLERWRQQQEQPQRGYYSNSYSYQKRDLTLIKRGELVHMVEEAEPLLEGVTDQVVSPTGNRYGTVKLGQHMRKVRDRKAAAQWETPSGLPRKFRKRADLASLMRKEDRPHLDKRTDAVPAAMAKILRQQRKRSRILLKRGDPPLNAAKDVARVADVLEKPISQETIGARTQPQQSLSDAIRRAERRRKLVKIAWWTSLGSLGLLEAGIFGLDIYSYTPAGRRMLEEYVRTHPRAGTTSGTEVKTNMPLQRRDGVLIKRTTNPPIMPVAAQEVAQALEVLGNPAAEDGLRDTFQAQQEQRNRRIAVKAGRYFLYGTGAAAGLAAVGVVSWQVAKAGRSMASRDKADGQHTDTEHLSGVKGTWPLQKRSHALAKRGVPRTIPVSEEGLAQAVEVIGNPIQEERWRTRIEQEQERKRIERKRRYIQRAKTTGTYAAFLTGIGASIFLPDRLFKYVSKLKSQRQQSYQQDDTKHIGEIRSTKQQYKRDHVLVKPSRVRPVDEVLEAEAFTRTGNPQLEERLALAKIYAKIASIVTAVCGGVAAIELGINQLVYCANEGHEKARNGQHKRAEILPVAEVDMIAAQEVTGNPLHHQWIQKFALFCDKLSKGLATTAAVLGVGTGVAYLIHKCLGPRWGKSNQYSSKRDVGSSDQQLLSKRDVQAIAPVAEDQLATTVEATLDPRYEEWKQNAAKLCKKVSLSVVAVLTTLGAGLGIGYFSYLQDKRGEAKSPETNTLPTAPIHDFIHPSSQQPRRLAKRSLTRLLESEEVISKRDSSTATAQSGYQRVKRGENADAGPAVMRVFRQVAIGARQSGINVFDFGGSDEPQPQPGPHHRSGQQHPTLASPPILLIWPPPGTIGSMLLSHPRWRDSQRDIDGDVYDRGQLDKRAVEAAEPEAQENRDILRLPLLVMISLGAVLAFKVENRLTVSDHDERPSGRRYLAHPVLYPMPRDRQRQTDWDGFPL